MSEGRGALDAVRAMRAELDERNRDNVSRTESYLELYAWTRGSGADLPWILMAHLVSRNAGYLMTDLARSLDATNDRMISSATEMLFVLLERANWLIFHDAWHHVCAHLLGESDTLSPPRTPLFACEAWKRYERARDRAGGAVSAALERSLVLDLVHNEQHLIENRAVHRRELRAGLDMLRMVEMFGQDKPLKLPWPGPDRGPQVRVGKFEDVDRRIAAGARIFDEALADRSKREAMFEWSLAHPHTGSRAVYGGRKGPTLRQVWPVERVRALWPRVHAPPEPDPDHP